MTDYNELKEKIETIFAALIQKHALNAFGSPLEPDIHQITKQEEGITVIFNDEHIAYLLGGYVSCSCYDEMTAEIEKIGYKFEDCDGCSMLLVACPY